MSDELVDSWFPDLPASARTVMRTQARVTLVRRYVENVIAIIPAAVTRLWGWRKDEAEAAMPAPH